MVIVQLITDNREPFRQYEQKVPWFGTAPEALLQEFTQLSGVEIHVVSCTQQPMESPNKLSNNIWFHSLHVPKIGWMRTGYQGCIRAARERIGQIKPDIVHGQGTERDCAISAVFSGFPNVLTLHGNMLDTVRATKARIGSFHWLAAHLENFSLRRTSGVFCNSAHTEHLVRPRTRKIWRVPNPLRTEFFQQPIPVESREKCILLNAGVICANKRQLEVLNLGKKLHSAGLDFEMWFVGQANQSDPYAAEFLRQIAVEEKKGFVRYLGLLSVNELIACLDKTSGLIHAPVVESFGLVVAEALSRNLKFFGNRVGGISDIALDAEGAELYETGDWEGLACGITKWIKDGAPRPSRTALLMRQRYHPKEITRRHLEIYQEILNA